MNDSDYYKHIYKLKFIDRYSNRYRIHNESVAEHSFFVAAIILKLYETYDFELEAALVLAISHDIMEADVSDVTHDIKTRHPNLARELNTAERLELVKYPLSVKIGYEIFESNSTVEGIIANLADVLQVQQYVLMEESLGNSMLNDIATGSRERIYKLKERLKEHERQDPKNIK